MTIRCTPRKGKLTSWIHTQKRGASLTGYGMVVGLIAVTAILAISDVGQQVKTIFGGVAETMSGGGGDTGGSGSGGGSGGGGEGGESVSGALLSFGEEPLLLAEIDGLNPGEEGASPGACTSFQLTNIGTETGGGDYQFSLVDLEGSSDAAQMGFCQPDADDLCTAELAPEESCSFGLFLTAENNGTYTALARVETADSLFASVEVTGTAINLSAGITPPTGSLTVFPITDETGSPGPCTPLAVTNSGTAAGEDFQISFSGTNPANFETCTEDLPQPCDQIFEPGETCDIGVRLVTQDTCSPQCSYSATAEISNGSLSATRNLTGLAYGLVPQLSMGTEPILIASLTEETESACVPLDVTNIGTASGGGGYALTFSGSGQNYFSTCSEGLTTPCSGALGAGATCQMGVRFQSILSGEHNAVARLSAAGGLTATVAISGLSTGEGLTCPYIGEGWCRSYSYPYPVGSTLIESLDFCNADQDCVGVSTYRHCINSADATCDNNNQARSLFARCTDLDFSIWPTRYATFACPAAILSLGEGGVLELGSFTGQTTTCLPLPVTNIGSDVGGNDYALSFTGWQASQFEACTDGLANPCTAVLGPGESCNMGVRLNATANGTITATAKVTTSDTNTASRSLRATVGGLAAELSFAAPLIEIEAIGGFGSACVPLPVTNSGSATGGGNYNLSFSGEDATLFSACTTGVTDRCANIGALAPEQSCNMGVRFSSYSAGTVSTTANLTASGGLTASTTLNGVNADSDLACPYLGPGWCDSWISNSFPVSTTFLQALTACESDAGCYGITTSQSCLTGVNEPCGTGTTSLYKKCNNLNFTKWPTNYATFACGKPALTFATPFAVDPIDGASGGDCTVLTISNGGAGATTGSVSAELSGSGASAFGFCTSGVSNPCSGAGSLDEGDSCQIGLQLAATENGNYSATLTVSADGALAVQGTVTGAATGIGPVLSLGSGVFNVTGINGGSVGDCTALPVTNTGLSNITSAISASFSGVNASKFSPCSSGISNSCGASLDMGDICNLGIRLVSSTDGTFSATVTASAAGAEPHNRTIQGTATNASSQGADTSGLQITMTSNDWIGVREIRVFNTLGQDVTDGMTAVQDPASTFGNAGELTSDSTYSSQKIHMIDNNSSSVAWNSTAGATMNVWLNFGSSVEIAEVRVTWINSPYPAPNFSFRDGSGLAIGYDLETGLPPEYGAISSAETWRFDFINAPKLDIGSGTFTVFSINNGSVGACTPLSVTNGGFSTINGTLSYGFSGGSVSKFATCTASSSPCGVSLAAGSSCNLGVRLKSATDGTFSSNVVVTAPDGQTGSRVIQGTATNTVYDTVVTGLHIAMQHPDWIGIYEIEIIHLDESNVTNGMTAISAPTTGFGSVGQMTSDTTYSASKSYMIDQNLSGITWSSNGSGTPFNVWLNFGQDIPIDKIHIFWSKNAGYGAPPNSVQFYNQSGTLLQSSNATHTNFTGNIVLSTFKFQ